MTRGTLVLINEDGVYYSTQFNGDMYPEGHGDEAVEMLAAVKSEQDFKNVIYRFNRRNFRYNEVELGPYFDGKPEKAFADMATDYYRTWNSDYLYIKNISKKDVDIPIRLEGEKTSTYSIKINEIIRLYFGHFDASYGKKETDDLPKDLTEEEKKEIISDAVAKMSRLDINVELDRKLLCMLCDAVKTAVQKDREIDYVFINKCLKM